MTRKYYRKSVTTDFSQLVRDNESFEVFVETVDDVSGLANDFVVVKPVEVSQRKN